MLLKQKEVTNDSEEHLFRLSTNFHNLLIYAHTYFSAHLPIISSFFFVMKMHCIFSGRKRMCAI